MELGIHLVAVKDLYRVAERYTDFLDRIAPDCIWLSDRLLVDDYSALAEHAGDFSASWREPTEFLDPFVAAAALVQYMPQPTQFGIAATDFIRRAPADLARAAYTLNQVLPKPLNMGFGAGEAINLKPLGYDFGSAPFAHFERCLAQFRRINRCGCPHIDESIELGYQRYPSFIWVAGQRPRMLQAAAIHADGWLPAWKMTSTEYRDNLRSLSILSAAAGRPVPVAGLFAMPIIGASKRALLDYFRSSPMSRAVAFMASGDLWAKWGLEHPAGRNSKGLFDLLLHEIPVEDLYQSLLSVPAEMLDDILFLGNVQELLDEFWQLREAGLQHLSLLLPDFSNARISYGVDNFDVGFDRLCREVQSW